jgi:hypothetical protein
MRWKTDYNSPLPALRATFPQQLKVFRGATGEGFFREFLMLQAINRVMSNIQSKAMRLQYSL